MGKRSPGRPSKYTALIDALEDDKWYTPKEIVAFALKHGFIVEDPLAKQRTYSAMSRLVWKMAAERNQHVISRSWPGWAWKQAVLR